MTDANYEKLLKEQQATLEELIECLAGRENPEIVVESGG